MPSVISMLGDMVPMLAGALLAERMKGRPTVALTWIGDGGRLDRRLPRGLQLRLRAEGCPSW